MLDDEVHKRPVLGRIRTRLTYELVQRWRGYGRPSAREVWDAQYRGGQWAFEFESGGDLARYMVLLGEIFHHSDGGRLLELGCGNGRLLRLLTLVGFDEYVGVDISSEGVKHAQTLDIQNATFVVADFDEWQSDDAFDVVIFNESLYYARRPQDTLARFASMLSDGGCLIVSMYRNKHAPGIWRRIRRDFEVLEQITVEPNGRRRYDIAVLKG